MITRTLNKGVAKSTLFMLLTLLAIPTSATRSQAQRAPSPTPTITNAVNPGQNSLTVSPPSYELTSNPGDVISNVIKVYNTSDSKITFESLVEDFSVQGTEGNVLLSENDNPNAFSKWFSIEPAVFDIAPKEAKSVTFTITVGKDAEPGGHFASVLFQPKAIGSSSGTGAQILQRVGVLVLMTVSGDIKEGGRISSFKPKEFSGNWETLVDEPTNTKTYIASNEDLQHPKFKSYFNNGPVAFDLVLKNEGNVFYKPKGTVTIYNMFGQKVEELQIQQKNVFPGGERRITVLFPKQNLWGMRYTAKAVVVYGSKSETLTAETSFWGFPTVAGAAIVVSLVVLLLLRKRLVKAFTVIAKG